MGNELGVANVLTFFSRPVQKGGLALGLFTTVVPVCIFSLSVLLVVATVRVASKFTGAHTITTIRIRRLDAIILIVVSLRDQHLLIHMRCLADYTLFKFATSIISSIVVASLIYASYDIRQNSQVARQLADGSASAGILFLSLLIFVVSSMLHISFHGIWKLSGLNHISFRPLLSPWCFFSAPGVPL
jgi:threonine/homoserine efflux transporter RhtA